MLPCGLNYVGVRFANITIGVICVTLGVYAREKSFFKDDVDVPFILVTGICTLEALIFIISSLRSNHNAELIWRFLCCSALVAVGTLLIHSAVSVQRFCENLPVAIGLHNCQLYKMKVTAGVLAIINGVIYPLARFSRSDTLGVVPFDIYSQVSENNHLVPPSPSLTTGNANPIMSDVDSSASTASTSTNANDPGVLQSSNSNDGRAEDADSAQFSPQGMLGYSDGRPRGSSPSPPQPIVYPRGYHPHVPLENHSTWENHHTKSRFPYHGLRL